jgi:beta-aspartyl-peptidase (threonine type)
MHTAEQWRIADLASDPQLIAAGEEDHLGIGDLLDIFLLSSILTRPNVDHVDVSHGCVFEADETFNTARGDFLNADGQVQLDAAIVEGRDLRFGALAAAQELRHPISVARQILSVGPLLLSGEGVRRFGATYGALLCDGAELITDKARRQWEKTERQLREHADTKPGGSDTVGCVALDADGLIAVGTSTAGEDHNPPGRVGDSALPGCGFYAKNTLGGCAFTGIGEAIIQVVLAKTAVELLADGLHPDDVAQQAIELLGERVKGEGGCIILDNEGWFGWAHNSADMPCAVMTSAMEQPHVWLKKAEDRSARGAGS